MRCRPRVEIGYSAVTDSVGSGASSYNGETGPWSLGSAGSVAVCNSPGKELGSAQTGSLGPYFLARPDYGLAGGERL